jgi:hypothetical protein
MFSLTAVLISHIFLSQQEVPRRTRSLDDDCPPNVVESLPNGRRVINVCADMVGLRQRTNIFRGVCHGREVEVVVTRETPSQSGAIRLRVGSRTVQLPATILNGALLRSNFVLPILRCDGATVHFQPIVIIDGEQWQQKIEYGIRSGTLRIGDAERVVQ